MITLKNSGKVISPNIEPPIPTTKTAQSPNPTTGRVPNNAPNLGNAEVPDFAKEVDGAQDMMDVREPHSQTKLQDSSQTTEQTDIGPELGLRSISLINPMNSGGLTSNNTLIYLS